MWFGNLHPMDSMQSVQTQKLVEAVDKYQQIIENKYPGDRDVQSLINVFNSYSVFAEYDAFKCGFKLGSIIMAEAHYES